MSYQLLPEFPEVNIINASLAVWPIRSFIYRIFCVSVSFFSRFSFRSNCVLRCPMFSFFSCNKNQTKIIQYLKWLGFWLGSLFSGKFTPIFVDGLSHTHRGWWWCCPLRVLQHPVLNALTVAPYSLRTFHLCSIDVLLTKVIVDGE